MKKFSIALMALLLILAGPASWADDVSGSGPDTSRFIMQLDSDLNFRVTMEYSDVAGGVANSTVFIMLTFKQGDKCLAYDVFPLKIKSGENREVLTDGKGKGNLEFSVLLPKYTDVESYDDMVEIRLFLVDGLGRKSKTKSLKFNNDRDNNFKFKADRYSI